MTIDQLKKVHQARPFRPFVLHTADSRSFRVQHPEFLMFSPMGRTCALYGDDDALEIIDLLLAATIEISNGRASVTPGQSSANGE